uniref:Aldo-keto reductase family 1, member C-like n=1 Tax=Mus musculus TaxID=10090 RepID=E0CYR9_MOUSE
MNPKRYMELSDGHHIPVLGFGTFVPGEVSKSMVAKATKIAIDAGFRHIDSAYFYQNEEEVGLAIRSKVADGTVRREDIFYTSKLPCTCHRPELVQPCLEQSLRKLQLDYVDLYLIHCPVSMKAMILFQQMKMGNYYLTQWISVTHGRPWRSVRIQG